MALDKLTLLAAELNMHSVPEGRKAQLEQLLTVAASKLAQTGITLDDGDTGDVHLQVTYAAWLFRRRAQTVDNTGMPRWLQLDIHDRLIHEKGSVSDGES